MEFRQYQLELVLKGLQVYLQQAQAVGGAPQVQDLMKQVQQTLVLGNNPALQAKLNQKNQGKGQPTGAA
jgi:hypothetical protein